MSRTADPLRKPALLAEIINFLLDKPLVSLSFRTVAAALGVSTYSLVYHFGNREQLMNDIVGSIMERQAVITEAVGIEGGNVDDHIANIRKSWQLGQTARSRSLMRLEFEAALLKSQDAVSEPPAGYLRWYEARVDALELMGIPSKDAEVAARALVDTMYGLNYDLLVTGDLERSSSAFELSLADYEKRIRALAAPATGTMAPWPSR